MAQIWPLAGVSAGGPIAWKTRPPRSRTLRRTLRVSRIPPRRAESLAVIVSSVRGAIVMARARATVLRWTGSAAGSSDWSAVRPRRRSAGYFGGRPVANASPRRTQRSRSASSAVAWAATDSQPRIGRPLLSNGRAPGSDSIS
jgi:hypothetical protein